MLLFLLFILHPSFLMILDFANSGVFWNIPLNAPLHPIMSIFNAMSPPDAALFLTLHEWPEG